MKTARKKPRRAVTLVEATFLIVIVLILLALFIPAVADLRGPSRRNQCATNMKNLALASIQHESTHQSLPGYVMDFGTFGINGKLYDPSLPDADVRKLDPHRKIGTWAIALLPWLDAQPTYEQWTEDRYPVVGGGSVEHPLSSGTSGDGYVAFAAPNLAIMQCPNNPVGEAKHGRNSYVINSGIYFPPATAEDHTITVTMPSGDQQSITFAESQSPSFGASSSQVGDTVAPDGHIVPVGPDIRLNDFTDGHGYTVLFSENVQAMPWHRAGFSDQRTLTIHSDAKVKYPIHGRFTNGMVWHGSDVPQQHLHHINGGDEDDRYNVTMTPANAADLARPSSAHVEGVNCGMADGSTRFIMETIDIKVWQSIMTPAGGDPYDADPM